MTPLRRDPRIPDLVGLEEAAAVLGVVKQYAQRLVKAGQIPGAIIGRNTYVFRRSVVERLRDQRAADSKKPGLGA